VAQPLRTKRMSAEKFQKQMEKNLQDPHTRRLSGHSRKPIPDVIFEERMLGLYKSLPPTMKARFTTGEYSSAQHNAIHSRKLIGDVPDKDFFNLRKVESASDGSVFKLEDNVESGVEREGNWHFAALFLPGGVAPTIIRGHFDTSGTLIPYDGNNDCIINMGLVKGNILQQAHILFGWEVIQEFITSISTTPTNFLRFFNTKIHMWCTGIRRHDGALSLPEYVVFISTGRHVFIG